MQKLVDAKSEIDRRVLAVNLLLVSIASLASYCITGFRFGIANNVFAIPVVLNLSESQEFIGDPYYDSLKYYISIVWPILRSISNESNIYHVFNTSHFISRFAAFAGILFLVRTSGVEAIAGLAICLMVVALTPWLLDYSVVGGHGMFIGYFTHSETTWAFIALSLALLSHYRFKSSAAMAGVAFSINAVVGIWLLIAYLGGLLSLQKSRTRSSLFKIFWVFLLFASPAAIWMLFAITNNESAVPFSYLEFTRAYEPGHSLIEDYSWVHLSRLFLIFANGILAAKYLSESKFWIAVQGALLLIFLIGIPLPYVLDSRFVHTLLLLRSSGVEQFIAIILSVIAGVKLLSSTHDFQKASLGAIALVSLAILPRGNMGLLIIGTALAAGLTVEQGLRNAHSSKVQRLLAHLTPILSIGSGMLFAFMLIREFLHHLSMASARSIELVIVVLILGLAMCRGMNKNLRYGIVAILCTTLFISIPAKQAYNRYHSQRITDAQQESWNKLVDWIRVSNIHGIFLIPIKDPFTASGERDLEYRRAQQFQLMARRRVWVEWKQGSAVLWSPSFYDQWMTRYKQVSALKIPKDIIGYAQSNGIKNVIIKSQDEACPQPAILVKVTKPYVLCQL